MSGHLTIIVAVSVSAVAGLLAVITLQRGRNRKLKTDLDNQKQLKRRAENRARNMRTVQEKQQEIRLKAEKEKRELEEADDTTLIDRSNHLFP